MGGLSLQGLNNQPHNSDIYDLPMFLPFVTPKRQCFSKGKNNLLHGAEHVRASAMVSYLTS